MDRNELLKCLKENTAHCFEPVSPDQRARLEETIGDSLPSDAWLILSLKDKSVELEQHGSHIIIMSPDEVMRFVAVGMTVRVQMFTQYARGVRRDPKHAGSVIRYRGARLCTTVAPIVMGEQPTVHRGVHVVSKFEA